MKKILLMILVICLMLLVSISSAAVLVQLDADDLIAGSEPNFVWPNTGTIGGYFQQYPGDPNFAVDAIDGLQAVVFDGTQGLISSFAVPTQLTGNNAWTVEALVRLPGDVPYEQTIASWAKRGSTSKYAALFYGWSPWWGAVAHWDWPDMGFDLYIPPGQQWHHLAVTFSGTTEKVYTDGILNSIEDKSLSLWDDGFITLGYSVGADWESDRVLFGTFALAELRFHDRVLTQEEIQSAAGCGYLAGTISPDTLEITEGDSDTFTIQLQQILGTPPNEDVEVTLMPVGDPRWLDLLAPEDVDFIQIASAAPGEPYTITFPVSTWDSPQSVEITTIDNTDLDPVKTVYLHVAVTAGDPDYLENPILPPTVSVNIFDDDWQGPCEFSSPTEGFIIDKFECPRDYQLHGVEGTIWDGFMGFDEGQYAITINDSVSNWGVLTMSSTDGSSWEGNNQSGPYLYRTITGDFIVETYVADYPGIGNEDEAIYHNDCGIMVRVPVLADAGAGEDDVQCSYFPIWGVGNILRYNDDGVRWEGDQTYDAFDADRYLQVERQGNDIYCRHSPDGVNWTAFPTANPLTRADFDGLPLQVGLQQAVYSDEVGWVEFEYFKVRQAVGELSLNTSLLEALESSAEITVAIWDDNLIGAPASDVVVTITPIGLGDDPNNSGPEDVRLDTELPGQPVAVTFTPADWMTPKTVTVTAVNDGLAEGVQNIGISYQVASDDPNFADAILANHVGIHILDGEAGLWTEPQVAEVWESGMTDSIEVFLTAEPDADDVTVNLFDPSSPENVTAAPSMLIFTEENWHVPQTVIVSAADDDLLEGDTHQAWLKIVATAATGSAYELIESGIRVNIHDNECGAWNYSWADLDKDCRVTLSDFAEMAALWITCSMPHESGCEDLR
jgi:hypothetical protein